MKYTPFKGRPQDIAKSPRWCPKPDKTSEDRAKPPGEVFWAALGFSAVNCSSGCQEDFFGCQRGTACLPGTWRFGNSPGPARRLQKSCSFGLKFLFGILLQISDSAAICSSAGLRNFCWFSSSAPAKFHAGGNATPLGEFGPPQPLGSNIISQSLDATSWGLGLRSPPPGQQLPAGLLTTFLSTPAVPKRPPHPTRSRRGGSSRVLRG